MSIQLDTILTYEIEIDFISENEIVLNFDSGLSVYQNGTRKVTGVKAIDFFDGTNTSVQVDLHNGRARVYVNSTASGSGGGVTSVDGQTGAVDLSSVYQPLDSDLTDIAALTTTAFGRSFLTQASAAASRSYIGVRDYIFDKTVTPQSVTGTTDETLLYSVLIPANTLQAGDIIFIAARWTKSGTNAAADQRVRFNTSSSLSGATLAANTTITSGNSYGAIERNILLDTLSSQSILSAAANQGSDAVTNLTSATLAIDFSVNQYVIFSGDLGGAGTDIHTLKWAYIQIIR